MKRLLKYWFPPALWAIIIFSFSAYPTKTASEIYWADFIVKKLAHIVEYGILTILLYRGFVNCGVNKKNAALYSILLSVIYGATDEFHQSFTPGREPRIRDVFFDTIGAILAIYGVWNWIDKLPKSIKKIFVKYQII